MKSKLPEIIKSAKEIATTAHAGQFRKFSEAGQPYINHPKRVAMRVPKELRPAAWLHDVLEDTKVSEEILRANFPKEVVDEVVVLTHKKKEENYFEYIMRVKKNPRAIVIKLADLRDNLSSLPEGSLKDKYRLAQFVLMHELLTT